MSNRSLILEMKIKQQQILKIIIVSQDSVVGASATAIVSVGGTISSISVSDGGKGYSSAPAVTIGNPVGYGTTARGLMLLLPYLEVWLLQLLLVLPLDLDIHPQAFLRYWLNHQV